MQVREALGREQARLGRRIVVEDGRLGHLAALEADTAAVLQIDGGIQDHRCIIARASAPVGSDGRLGSLRPRPSLRYHCRRTMGDVRPQSRPRRASASPRVHRCRSRRQAAALRGRRRRHLDRALAACAAQGAAGALRLRPTPPVRDLGGEALRRQPRQGQGALYRALSGPCRPHRLRPPSHHPAQAAPELQPGLFDALEPAQR